MRIHGLRVERSGARARIVARVQWETSRRNRLDVFFETGGEGAADFAAEPDAMLSACFLPAMRQGEERIAIDGAVCPALAQELSTAARLIESWGGPPRRMPRIEPEQGFRSPRPRRPPRAAAFLSGGVHSLHLIARNRADYPEGHPERFRDALAIFGLHSPERLDRADPLAAFAGPSRSLEAIARDAGLRLVTVATNLTALEPDAAFLAEEFLAAALVSSAHLGIRRWSTMSIASGRDVAILTRSGSHPLLDPRLSTGALQIRHVGAGFTRQEKLEEVCRWEAGLRELFVCTRQPSPPQLNCGRCEKCLRTMTGLEALGRLSSARRFPDVPVSAEMIRAAGIDRRVAPYWRDLVAPLRERGRGDLADAVERGLAEAARGPSGLEDRGWKGRLRRLDRRVFRGGFDRLARRHRTPP